MHHPDIRFPLKPSPDSLTECDDWCPKKDGGGPFRLSDRLKHTRLWKEDERVSPYPSQGNIQVVTKTSFAQYLVKYATKVKPTRNVSNLLDDVRASQLPREGPEQSGLQSVNPRARKIAISKATYILFGQSLCLRSRVYMYVYTPLSHLRLVVVT